MTQLPAAGVDLVMETGEGELVVGTGPLGLAELGFGVQEGGARSKSYWEDDEFKAAKITLLASDQIIVLRDG